MEERLKEIIKIGNKIPKNWDFFLEKSTEGKYVVKLVKDKFGKNEKVLYITSQGIFPRTTEFIYNKNGSVKTHKKGILKGQNMTRKIGSFSVEDMNEITSEVTNGIITILIKWYHS